MAWRIVKQPNGLYARWSDVVDDFTHTGFNRASIVDVCRGHAGIGKAEAEEKVDNADREELIRWPECLSTLRALGKADRAAEKIAECS